MIPRVYSLRFDPDIEGVYIGRRGRGSEGLFGSPVILGARCPICHTIHRKTVADLDAACRCYEAHLIRRLVMDPEFERAFDALEGKNLICFCAPKGGIDPASTLLVCYGQVMLRMIEYRRIWGLRADQQLK